MTTTLFWVSLAVDVLSLLVVVPALIVEYRRESNHHEPD